MTSKADYLAAASLLTQLANAQPDDAVVPPPPPNPFTDKSYYPPLATLNADSADFDPAAKVINVRVSLDGPTPMTVIQRFTTKNGTLKQGVFVPVDVTLIWRPGDALERTIAIPVLKPGVEGGSFQLVQPNVPKGANRGTAATLTARTGAVGQQPIAWNGRPPRTFNPSGTLKFDLDIPNMKWSDAGGPDTWRTALDGGRRMQLGNNETGLYLDEKLFPGIEPPFVVSDGVLTIHSQQLATPITVQPNGVPLTFNYGAAVLTGELMPQTHLAPKGAWEWVAKSCSTPGSWPALWGIGEHGWPPEIDVYEGFNYDATFDGNLMTSCAIHGGPRGTQKFGRGCRITAAEGGFSPTLASDFHAWAADRDGTYITFFVGGLETYQMIDPFPFDSFFPLMNVAVRTTDPYASGDLQVRSYKVWSN